MNLRITYPDDFPLHGLDRDMFETKLRSALRFCFYGNTIRQLAEKVDARRVRVAPGTLPLHQIADEHAFEECMLLDGCRIDDMTLPLRRKLLRSVGNRVGLTISDRSDGAWPDPDEADEHTSSLVTDHNATNRQSAGIPDIKARQPARTARVLLATGLCAVAIGGVAWKSTRPAAPLSATVVSTSPAQTLRELASSVPADHRPYRVSVQIEPQDTEASQIEEKNAHALPSIEPPDLGNKPR